MFSKFSPKVIPHSKRVSKIFIFYIKKRKFWKKFKDKIGSKYTPNGTILKKFLEGTMPPNPPSKAHGFAMRSMTLRYMQISKSEKKFLVPPPKSWLRPCCPHCSPYLCFCCTCIHAAMRIKLHVCIVLCEVLQHVHEDDVVFVTSALFWRLLCIVCVIFQDISIVVSGFLRRVVI